ncbi:hypothetical protein IANJMKHF_00298 [Klebsiella phage CPRSA]|nr:hypothetical protein IANJMKHF_00298 [Klebsiella phage CPRSA]
MTDVVLNVKDIVLGDKVIHPDAVTLEQAVVKVMRDSLRLEVNEITETCYTGGFDGNPLYRDAKA